MLDPTAECATAHHPHINEKLVVALSCTQYGDLSQRTVFVPVTCREQMGFGILQIAPPFRIVESSSVQVELIRLIDQLERAGIRRILDRAESDLGFVSLEKVRGQRWLGAEAVCPKSVFFRNEAFAEQIAEAIEQSQTCVRIVFRKQQTLNAGKSSLHFSQLHGAVIYKDNAVRTDVPGLQDAADCYRLWAPAHFDREDVIHIEQEVGPCERLADHGRIVFAGNRHEHTRVCQDRKLLLVERMMVAMAIEGPRDAVNSGFADDAAPKSVIEVCDQTFFRQRETN